MVKHPGEDRRREDKVKARARADLQTLAQTRREDRARARRRRRALRRAQRTLRAYESGDRRSASNVKPWALVVAFILVIALGATGVVVSANDAASESNRVVLCIGILHNPSNPARNDPKLQELCRSVGITKYSPPVP